MQYFEHSWVGQSLHLIVVADFIQVDLRDINDHAPEFNQSIHHIYNLAENSARGTHVITLSATDLDSADNSIIEVS